MTKKSRSIAKALTWRVIATSVTFSVAWILTGEIVIAAEIGVLDALIKMAAYYYHERFWLKVAYGK